jgi:hypothetical protein
MRFIRWFFRRGGVAEPRTCRHCTHELQLCPSCSGAWQNRACRCGIGWVCTTCGPHWA